jgi:hypothetical protein
MDYAHILLITSLDSLQIVDSLLRLMIRLSLDWS